MSSLWVSHIFCPRQKDKENSGFFRVEQTIIFTGACKTLSLPKL